MAKIIDFSLKFIDIMVGLVLGLGFQWWPFLSAPWQYVAFIFTYLDLVDFWIDYGPALKKFPPKREVDVLLDIAICFSMFLYIYATQLALIAYLGAFILLRILDFFWLLSSKIEYSPQGFERTYLNTWMLADLLQSLIAATLCLMSVLMPISPMIFVVGFIFLIFVTRFFASFLYKKVHLT